MAKVFPGIVEIVSQASGFDPALITPRTLLIKHLGLDSLDLIEVENELGIHFNVAFVCPRQRDISVQEIMDRINELLIE